MIPLYGFLEGDTIGLLVLADEDEFVGELVSKLQGAARVRVRARPGMKVLSGGRVLDLRSTVQHAGLRALDRFDVVEGIS